MAVCGTIPCIITAPCPTKIEMWHPIDAANGPLAPTCVPSRPPGTSFKVYRHENSALADSVDRIGHRNNWRLSHGSRIPVRKHASSSASVELTRYSHNRSHSLPFHFCHLPTPPVITTPSHLLLPSTNARKRCPIHDFAVSAISSICICLPVIDTRPAHPALSSSTASNTRTVVLAGLGLIASVLLYGLPVPVPAAASVPPHHISDRPWGNSYSISSPKSRFSRPSPIPSDCPPLTAGARSLATSSVSFSEISPTAAGTASATMPAGTPDSGVGSFLETATAAGGSSDYNTLVTAHGHRVSKRSLFTADAWDGMVRLMEYDRMVAEIEAEEKQCRECTKNRRLLEQVWQTVSNEFFDPSGNFSQSKWSGELAESLRKAGGPLKTKSQTYAAVKEMVSHLNDRWSSFLEPSHYRLAIHRPIPTEIKYLAFQYTGIGIELGGVSPLGGRVIIAPYAGSPAEEGGIRGGDELLSVDGRSLSSVPLEEAVTILRGPTGSLVDVVVARGGSPSPPQLLTLERRSLPLPPLQLRVLEGPEGRQVAYIRLRYFSSEGTKGMAAAIRTGEGWGVDGYVLDLRNDPGGVFEEAIATAALWVDCDSCELASTVRSSEGQRDVRDSVYKQNQLPKYIFGKHPGALTHAPLVLLTNRNSASASEVLVGALRDNGRAAVVGEETFGKGVVQYYFPMDDGSGLKLTVAKYLTPSNYDISRAGGISPDIQCHDFPRSNLEDECILIGKKMVVEERAKRDSTLEAEGQTLPFGRMPYRWVPSRSDQLWAVGSE